jgi:hypothetical protein
MRQLNEYREEILKEFPNPEDFIKLWVLKRGKLKYFDRWLRYISTLYGIEEDPVVDKKIFSQFAQKLYGVWHECIDLHLLNEEDWQTRIKKIYEDPKDFMWVWVLNFSEVFWMSMFYLLNEVFWIEVDKKDNIRPKILLVKIAQKVYWEWHECVDVYLMSQEDWIREIKNKFQTPESFMLLSTEDKGRTYVKWKGLKYISNTVFKMWQTSILRSGLDQAGFARKIYWSNHDIIEVHFWDPNTLVQKFKEKYSEDYIRGLTSSERADLDFLWFKLHALSSKVWVKGNPLSNNDIHSTFCDMVWE